MNSSDSAWAYCVWRFNRWLQGGETYNSIDAKASSGELRVGEMKPAKCFSCGFECQVHPLLNRSRCCDAKCEVIE